MIVPVAFLVFVVIVSLGRTLLALPVGDDAKGHAFTDPKVCTFAVGGNEVLRFGLHGLARALAHENTRKDGEADTGDEAENQGLGTWIGLVHRKTPY